MAKAKDSCFAFVRMCLSTCVRPSYYLHFKDCYAIIITGSSAQNSKHRACNSTFICISVAITGTVTVTTYYVRPKKSTKAPATSNTMIISVGAFLLVRLKSVFYLNLLLDVGCCDKISRER